MPQSLAARSPVSPSIAPRESQFHNHALPIVDGLLWNGDTTLITGASKTQFALQLAHAVAAGRPFLDFAVPVPLPVLYVGQPLSADVLTRRLTNLTLYLGPSRYPLHYASSKSMLLDVDAIGALADRYRPRVLVLDSLPVAVDGQALATRSRCAVAMVRPWVEDADTVALIQEDEEDGSDFPTFALRVKRDREERRFTIRRLGAIFQRVE